MHEVKIGEFMGEKRATLKDVAERSGYALRTVKNVVAGKASVGEPVREAVLKAMQELDYKQNFLASTLAKNRTYRIAVVIFNSENEHQQDMLKGIRKAGEQFEDYGLQLEYHLTPKQVHAQEVVLEEFYEREDLDGIILQPSSADKLSRQINLLMYGGKPVVLIDTQTTGNEQLCYVGLNHEQVGRVSAQLLGGYLQGRGCLLVVYQEDFQSRVDAFGKYVLECFPKIRMTFHKLSDANGIPFQKAMANNRPEGIYGCCEEDAYLSWLEEEWKETHPIVLTNDISYENRDRMKRGIVDLIVGEETEETGYQATDILFRYLSASQLPAKKIFSKITILTSECL